MKRGCSTTIPVSSPAPVRAAHFQAWRRVLRTTMFGSKLISTNYFRSPLCGHKLSASRAFGRVEWPQTPSPGIFEILQLGAGGKPSTWLQPGRFEEHNQHRRGAMTHRDCAPDNNTEEPAMNQSTASEDQLYTITQHQ